MAQLQQWLWSIWYRVLRLERPMGIPDQGKGAKL